MNGHVVLGADQRRPLAISPKCKWPFHRRSPVLPHGVLHPGASFPALPGYKESGPHNEECGHRREPPRDMDSETNPVHFARMKVGDLCLVPVSGQEMGGG